MRIGKVPENVLKRAVFRQIRARQSQTVWGPGIGWDCAGIKLSEGEILLTCMQEAYVAAGRETLGRFRLSGQEGQFRGVEPFMTMSALIQKCANNLAAGGARPVAVLLTLLLPETMQEPELRALMAEAEEKCQELSIQVVGGQTRVTRGTLLPMAVAAGYGAAEEEYCGRLAGARPGDEIVLSKWIGLYGTALLAARHRERLLERFPGFLVEEARGFERYLSILPEARIAWAKGASSLHDASEGGILGALWEMAERAGTGLEADMRKLPLRQETVEICEVCGENPYLLSSGGCLVMTAPDGAGLAAALEKERIPAAVVGRITEGNDRILVNEGEIRYLDRP